MTCPSIFEILTRKIIFVTGKGGVGKTVLTEAIARGLAANRDGDEKNVLWVTIEDPAYPAGEVRALGDRLSHLNCDATQAFDEYVGMKIGIPTLAKIFTQNKLMKYLSQAAPGIHELVLLGKVWFERNHFDHVVVDMPSTGYGLAMFHSAYNFRKLFSGGPLYEDAGAMIDSFSSARESGVIIAALPEEMPLREAIELDHFLLELFPENRSAFVVNRCFPEFDLTDAELKRKSPHSEAQQPVQSPVPTSLEDYAIKRTKLEKQNLKIWAEIDLLYSSIPYLLNATLSRDSLITQLTATMETLGWFTAQTARLK